MNRFPILTAVTAALFFGCIENPGPDKELGRERRQANASVDLRGPAQLEFRLLQDAGRVSLSVKNSGWSTLDSSAFVIEIGHWDICCSRSRLLDHPAMEYYGRVGYLNHGESYNIDDVGSLSGGYLADFDLRIYIIKASVGGVKQEHPLAGFFTGGYSGRDTVQGEMSGNLRAIIDEDGNFDIVMAPLHPIPRQDPSYSTPYYATGRMLTDSTGRIGFIFTDYFYGQTIGKLHPNGDGLEMEYRFTGEFEDPISRTFATDPLAAGTKWRDSLDFHLSPEAHR